MIFIVAREACERLLGAALEVSDAEAFFLPAEMRAIALAIRDCALQPAAALPYRLAKSIELLCEILGALGAGKLTRANGPATLSQLDLQRIASPGS